MRPRIKLSETHHNDPLEAVKLGMKYRCSAAGTLTGWANTPAAAYYNWCALRRKP